MGRPKGALNIVRMWRVWDGERVRIIRARDRVRVLETLAEHVSIEHATMDDVAAYVSAGGEIIDSPDLREPVIGR